MAASGKHPVTSLYANLMDEVKVRIDCIDRAVKGQTGFPGPIVREFYYTQLRLLCELIALSCLVAHGDIAATYAKRLGKEWSADKIIDQLTKMQPHFYPQPMRQTPQIINGVEGWHMEAINPPSFPKESLLDLYGKCHRHLHRGNVNKLMTSDTPIEVYTNFPEIIDWAQKINDHLSLHIIVLKSEQAMFCMLRNAEDSNRVQAGFIGKKPD